MSANYVTDFHKFARIPYPLIDALVRGDVTPFQFCVLVWLWRKAIWNTGVVRSFSAEQIVLALDASGFIPKGTSTNAERNQDTREEYVRRYAMRPLLAAGWYTRDGEHGYIPGKKTPYDITLSNYLVCQNSENSLYIPSHTFSEKCAGDSQELVRDIRIINPKPIMPCEKIASKRVCEPEAGKVREEKCPNNQMRSDAAQAENHDDAPAGDPPPAASPYGSAQGEKPNSQDAGKEIQHAVDGIADFVAETATFILPDAAVRGIRAMLAAGFSPQEIKDGFVYFLQANGTKPKNAILYFTNGAAILRQKRKEKEMAPILEAAAKAKAEKQAQDLKQQRELKAKSAADEKQKRDAAEAERQRLAALSAAEEAEREAERQRVAAEAEQERQRLAAAETERQRLAAEAENARKLPAAVEFLEKYLRDGYFHPVGDLQIAANVLSVGDIILQKAADALGVVQRNGKPTLFGFEQEWRLPQESAQAVQS